MTATQQFKILEILEPTLGREKATELTKSIEEVIDAKVEEKVEVLATKEDLYKATSATKEDLYKTSAATREDLHKTSVATREDLHKATAAIREDLHKFSVAAKEDTQRAYEKLEGRLWTTFITLVVMILGLYATIIFRH